MGRALDESQTIAVDLWFDLCGVGGGDFAHFCMVVGYSSNPMVFRFVGSRSGWSAPAVSCNAMLHLHLNFQKFRIYDEIMNDCSFNFNFKVVCFAEKCQ